LLAADDTHRERLHRLHGQEKAAAKQEGAGLNTLLGLFHSLAFDLTANGRLEKRTSIVSPRQHGPQRGTLRLATPLSRWTAEQRS